MIDIKPVVMNESQKNDLLQSFESADMIVCTSWYAGEYFVKSLRSIKPVDFKNKIFAVIGRRTQKALEEHGIQATVVSYEETAQGLLKAITQHMDLKGQKVLFPRSSLPNPFLKEALTAHGAQVTEITIYENTKPPKRDLPSGNIDGVIFTSPSTVQNFLADYARIPDRWRVLAKGPVTLKTLQEAGYTHATSLS
jgi:uroporphyrinogen-III synthase